MILIVGNIITYHSYCGSIWLQGSNFFFNLSQHHVQTKHESQQNMAIFAGIETYVEKEYSQGFQSYKISCL